MHPKTIAGHFTKLVDNSETCISREEATRLLSNHWADVSKAIAELEATPGKELSGEDCRLRYTLLTQPPVTADQGGPSLRGTHLFSPQEQCNFLLGLVADHDPLSYAKYYQRYQELDPPELDRFAADLMEVLDNVAGPDITFTVRPTGDDGFMTLGFWPTLEEETDEPS